jgi:hypothetical protein
MKKLLCKSVFVALFAFTSIGMMGCSKYYIPSTTPKPTAAPAPDTAPVYFVKTGGSWGKANGFILMEDQAIGYLENRLCFFTEVPAGKHLFMSVTSNADAIDADLAGGKTYYVRLFSTPGAMSILGGGSENLYIAPIEPGTEQWESRHEWIDRCRLVELNTEKSVAWEDKYAARNAERLEKFRSGEAEVKKLLPEYGE